MVTRDTDRLSSATLRSNIDLMVIHCATLVFWQDIHSLISSSTASTNASPIGVYSQRPFRNQVILPEVHYATQIWRLPSNLIMLGVTTHNSDPKIFTN